MARPRLLLFPASLRRGSHQRRLIDYFAAVIGETCSIDILGASEADLPIFNQDLERSAPVLERVVAVEQRFRAADGIIVASPEYNGHVAPYLKNTVDWVSRLARIDPVYAAASPFLDKPLLLASASTGWSGGVLGLQDARTLFSYLGCLVTAQQIFVSDAEQWAGTGSFRFADPFAQYIDATLTGFLTLVGSLAHARGGKTPRTNGEAHA